MDRTILIKGASSVIGKETAKLFQSMNVVSTSWHDKNFAIFARKLCAFARNS